MNEYPHKSPNQTRETLGRDPTEESRSNTFTSEPCLLIPSEDVQYYDPDKNRQKTTQQPTRREQEPILDRDGNGRIKTSVKNLSALLKAHSDFRDKIQLNLRDQKVYVMAKFNFSPHAEEKYPREIRDTDVIGIKVQIDKLLKREPTTASLEEAVGLVADSASFDPIQDYLEALKWDCEPRLDTWLHRYLGTRDSAYESLVGAKWMIATVARALSPGCQVDNLLVLEGKQGSGKTTALRILALDKYLASDPPSMNQDKEFKEYLLGTWIVELGELESIRNSAPARIKNMLTTTEDKFRLPYGRRSQTVPRRMVFVATTNEAHYLTDTTGNRRFWPIKTGEISSDKLKRDRDQLWAEAVARYYQREPWHLEDRKEIELAETEQRSRLHQDPWEEPLATGLIGEREYTTSEILADILGIETARQDRKAKIRVCNIMRSLGCVQQLKRKGALRVRVWRKQDTKLTQQHLSHMTHDF